MQKTIQLSTAMLLAFAVTASAQTINEIRIDQPSTDFDEYFELLGTPSASLNGLSYLVLGEGTGGSGVIEHVTDLTGQSLDGNGFFVAAEATFTLGTADLTTDLNFENSDNVTHMLVSGFTGSSGDDLDADDDGTLDATPWTSVVDCVALIETVGSGELVYCDTQVGPEGPFVPGHVFVSPIDGWQIGYFDVPGTDDTPGAANPDAPLPVELTSFEALVDGSNVTLRWSTASETNNAGFAIERRLTDGFEEIGFVAGAGTTADRMDYTFVAGELTPGTHSFRLRQVDFDGVFTYSAVIEVDVALGDSYVLSEAYPNPFNPATTIELAVKESQAIRVDVFNVLGRRVATLFDAAMAAGQLERLHFQADGLPSGIYVVRVQGAQFTESRRVTLLK